jgi:hydrogenase expression/formation protein HypD
MEVCGTHTMAIARAGLRALLPPSIRLVSGPGCPVCVSPVGYVDHALALCGVPGVMTTTFGDLVRVPGSAPGSARPPSLERARAEGADVRVVDSPLGALELARAHPSRQVVFLGVGFETTAPTVAAAVLQAEREELDNFSVLSAHKTIPEAMELLAAAEDLELDGVLCPGHVSNILGPEPYLPLVERHGLACAIAGFEPVEVLAGLRSLVAQVDAAAPRVDNCYPGAVRAGGNPKARQLMAKVFEACDSRWRGLGVIARSGLAIRAELGRFDAARRFAVELPEPVEPVGCRCGEVLRGTIEPPECPLFGDVCTPETPHGACMVSSEGTCAAHHHHGAARAEAERHG